MAEKSNSINLSEFFNDDDSEGHRLVEFIKKRRGITKKQNYLFMNYEPERLSLNVQVEKVANPQVKPIDKQLDKESEIQINELVQKENDDHLTSVSPERQPSASANTVECSNQRLPSPLQRLSPRISTIRRSGGGISPSDRLRRYSLKRLTKLCGGRRTLLQEFENTIEGTNFEPPVCSTPFSQGQENEEQPPTDSNQLPDSEEIEQKNEESPNTNESCCVHTGTLIRTLQRKDKELKGYMESLLDKTLKNISKENESNNPKSPLKRTFIVEKGSIPGQVILTSDKSCGDQVSQHTKSKRSLSLRNRKNHEDQTDKGPVSQSTLSNRQNQNSTSQYAEKADVQVPQTTKDRSVVLIFPTKDVEVPPTEELPESRANSVIICSGSEQPIVVLPQHGSITKTKFTQIPNNNESREFGRNHRDKKSTTLKEQQIPSTIENDNDQILQQDEDNLRLSDILTDDEEPSPSLQISKNGSQRPLNLASTTSNMKKTRLQVRNCSKQKSQADQSHQNNTAIAADFSSPANNMRSRAQRDRYMDPSGLTNNRPSVQHNKRPVSRRAYEPLNRAPGIPINGEKYAQELTRMSNCEILDLRKRNSMGQIFDIPGRISRHSLKEVINKRRQLDEEIEKELIRRALNKPDDHNAEIDLGVIESQEIFENVPPPPNFLDSLDLREKGLNFNRESSLVDETPCDLITFKSTESIRRRKKVPQLLKQYLEVSKKCSKKRKPSISNKSKRSLYSQDLYEVNEYESLAEKANSTEEQEKRYETRQTSLPFVESPPKHNSLLTTTLKVVSPPPPLSTTTTSEGQETSNNEHINIEDMCLPPPPPGFESDSGISSNNNNNMQQYSTNETLEAACVSRKTNTTSNDDHLFKKPKRPAPRNRGRKKKSFPNDLQKSTASSQVATSSSDDLTVSSSLRRSKRGQVKRCVPPMIQLLMEQTWLRENKKAKNKSPLSKSKSKTNPRKHSKKGRPVAQLEIVNEDEETDEHLETRPNIQMSPPTPSSPPNAPVQTAPPQNKIKPLKVRLCRLKPSSNSHDRCADATSDTDVVRNNSNIELIDWLKRFIQSDDFEPPSEILKEMRISGATKLCFTEIQGLEYAFYDTNEKSSLGYLRFKPQQSKPRKKTKRYHLHYVNLSGIFRITTDNSSRLLYAGDMVVIEKHVYYDIKNVSDDIGILMVVKK